MCHTVSAGVAAAFVVPLLAVGTHEAGRAAAAVTAGRIFLTGASVETWPVRASHCTAFTVLPIEALRACAGVVIHQILERKQEKEQGQEVKNLRIFLALLIQQTENKNERQQLRHSRCSCRRFCRGCCRIRWSESHS